MRWIRHILTYNIILNNIIYYVLYDIILLSCDREPEQWGLRNIKTDPLGRGKHFYDSTSENNDYPFDYIILICRSFRRNFSVKFYDSVDGKSNANRVRAVIFESLFFSFRQMTTNSCSFLYDEKLCQFRRPNIFFILSKRKIYLLL